jgi:formylglycine-generating enzyme required for sulfatase activity
MASDVMMQRSLSALVFLLIASTALAAPPLVSPPFDDKKAADLRRAWAKESGLDAEFNNSVGMKFVLIPAGRFEMGPNGSRHAVTLTKPYHLATTEVTLGQYRKFKAGHKIDKSDEEFNADDRPCAMVSWNDAVAFCKWLSDQPKEKAAGRVYHLPTEAQWEWAARAGTKIDRHFGETARGQEKYSVFNVTYTPNPKHETKGRGRQKVASLLPNAFGLYDMLGNVWEWCADRRGDEETGEVRDPVMRGGSWRSGAFHCTSVAHDPGAVTLKGDHIGFRVACRVVKK